MTDALYVVFDTNFFEYLKWIDGNCELVELIINSYGNMGIADHPQLLIMDYCKNLPQQLNNHGITDEQVAIFTMSYRGSISIQRIKRDPTDLKLIIFAIDNPSSIFLTCETGLLALAEDQKVRHACFKAAAHELDTLVGGLFGDPTYKTASMFEPGGCHPFFHYKNATRCPQCDAAGKCKTRRFTST